MARTRIAKFNIQISANAEQVKQVFSRLREQTNTTIGKLTSSLTSVSFAWNEISQAIGPVVEKFRELNAELLNLAQVSTRLEVPSEFLQTLEIAGQRAGVEFDRITDGLTDFQERVGQLRRGENAVTDVFGEVGLSSKTLSKDLGTAFIQVSDAISDMRDQTRRASVATELFGEAGRQMLEIFSPEALAAAARELDRLGGAITNEDLEAIEGFNDAWNDLTRTFKLVGQQLTVSLAPALEGIAIAVKNILVPFEAVSRFVDKLGIDRSTLALASPTAGFLASRGAQTTAQQTLQRLQTQADPETKQILRGIERNTRGGIEVIGAGVQ